MMQKHEWYEPAPFKRQLLRAQGYRFDWKFGILFTLGVAVVIIGAAHWHQNPVGGSWFWTYVISFLPGILVMGVIPLIEMVSTNRIVASEKGLTRSIVRGAGLHLHHWPWDQIVSAQVGSVVLDDTEFPALWITFVNEETTPIAITPQTDHQFLKTLFAMNDKPYLEGT